MVCSEEQVSNLTPVLRLWLSPTGLRGRRDKPASGLNESVFPRFQIPKSRPSQAFQHGLPVEPKTPCWAMVPWGWGGEGTGRAMGIGLFLRLHLPRIHCLTQCLWTQAQWLLLGLCRNLRPSLETTARATIPSAVPAIFWKYLPLERGTAVRHIHWGQI